MIWYFSGLIALAIGTEHGWAGVAIGGAIAVVTVVVGWSRAEHIELTLEDDALRVSNGGPTRSMEWAAVAEVRRRYRRFGLSPRGWMLYVQPREPKEQAFYCYATYILSKAKRERVYEAIALLRVRHGFSTDLGPGPKWNNA